MFSRAKPNIQNIFSFPSGLSGFLDNVFHLVFPFLSWAASSISSMFCTRNFSTWGAWQVLSMQGNLAVLALIVGVSWQQQSYSDTSMLHNHFWCHGCCWSCESHAIAWTPVHGGSIGSIIRVHYQGLMSPSDTFTLLPSAQNGWCQIQNTSLMVGCCALTSE